MSKPDKGLLSDLRNRDSNPPPVAEIIIENDNPAWISFTRVGLLVRELGWFQSAQLQNISKEGKLEMRLPVGSHILGWQGYRFIAEITREDNLECARVKFDCEGSYNAFASLMFHAKCHSRCKHIEDEDKVVSKVLRNGAWKSIASSPKRKIGSVIIEGGIPSDLLCDMQDFIESSPEYIKFGFPYKRNYLIIGPPGSGKSSLISATASELDLDICYLTVTPNMTERELSTGILALSERCMLVIEDIDILCNSSSGTSAIALGVLTNILDGTLHRHGLITVLTSTKPIEPENVLFRHGRVDKTCQLSYLTREQTNSIVEYYMGASGGDLKSLSTRIWNYISHLQLSSTALVHFLFRNRKMNPCDICEKEIRTIASGDHTGDQCETVSGKSDSAMYM